MPISVFVTGVTGYVGGDALTVIHEKHPDWTYRFLVRTADKGQAVLAAFPNSHLVIGDLDALKVLRNEAENADIVLHFASSDHDTSSQALIDGVAARDVSQPGFFVQVSGTGLLIHAEMESMQNFGREDARVYDDVADIEDLLVFPDEAMHRSVEKLVQHTSTDVYRMIVSPPAIVGTGRGPGNTRSMILPILADIFRHRGTGFQIDQGLGRWNYIHVADLANLFLLIVDNAANRLETKSRPDPEIWGQQGYFFAENGDLESRQVSLSVAEALYQHAPSTMTDPGKSFDKLTVQEAMAISPMVAIIAANSRSRATRARKLLGWKPKFQDWEASANEAVKYELEHAVQSRLEDFAQGKRPAGPAPASSS